MGSIKGLEFPKIRGTLFWGPCNNDPTTLGTILGSPYFRKLPNPSCEPNVAVYVGGYKSLHTLPYPSFQLAHSR